MHLRIKYSESEWLPVIAKVGEEKLRQLIDADGVLEWDYEGLCLPIPQEMLVDLLRVWDDHAEREDFDINARVKRQVPEHLGELSLRLLQYALTPELAEGSEATNHQPPRLRIRPQ